MRKTSALRNLPGVVSDVSTQRGQLMETNVKGWSNSAAVATEGTPKEPLFTASPSESHFVTPIASWPQKAALTWYFPHLGERHA
jgi:hypothetical protein